uniref:NADH-ubiquinone oxidoreductase chain 6 n=1 Tax=Micromus angulatus TaxID=1230847 RepID=A0A4D6NZ91_9NEOP|nr:NADH dehydrogenase subunit 6 [Micromus angulatus]ARO47903.1 NADH dehydrogenase subunit 6 [Micromus angulatus]QCE31818.1 NADH dehydrogenase subunit 6 [Micromus angulatus]
MNIFIILLSSLLSINFINMKHPLSMGLILLIQTLLISLICGMTNYTFWFSYILFLIMVGGMLILFMYMTSLASNEIFKININTMIVNLMMIFLLILITIIFDNMIMVMKNYESINFLMIKEKENSFNLIKLYNNYSMNMTILLINYLFLTLIIIVNITKINYGPLRQNN